MDFTKDMIVGAIRGCKTSQELDNVFETCKITEKQKKIDYIIDAMYNPKVFFSNEDPILEQRYIMTIEMFLTFTWKFTELCTKVGV